MAPRERRPPREAGATTREEPGPDGPPAGEASVRSAVSSSGERPRGPAATTTTGSPRGGSNSSAPASAPLSRRRRWSATSSPAGTEVAVLSEVRRSATTCAIFMPPGSRRREHASRQAAGVLAVLDHEPSVDHHVLDADGIAMRIVEGRLVGDLPGVEHDQVGPRALADLAAIA